MTENTTTEQTATDILFGESAEAAQAADETTQQKTATTDGAATTDNSETVIELKLPDGFDMPEETANELKQIVGSGKSPQEILQSLADLHVKTVKEEQEKLASHIETVQSDYIKQVKSDPELGGANFDRAATLANKAITELGGASLVKAITDHGMANHPEVVRLFYRLGIQLSEATPVKGAAVPKTESAADILFGSNNKGK
jgi:hypothetical protein